MASIFSLALTLGLAAGAPVAQSSGKGGIALMGPEQTGVFGAGNSTAPPRLSGKGLTDMLGPVLGMKADTSGGSGPYKASFAAIPGFPKHTMYMPKSPPTMKLPVIVWGNGACSGNGAWFSKFLDEIASHGYFIIANGAPDGTLAAGSTARDILDAIDWVFANAGKGQFAAVDPSQLAAAGQSCGGIQAYSASLDPRVKLTGIFNSGLLNENNTHLFDQLHAPIGFFLGGKTDIAYLNGERDYKNMPAKIPVTKLNLPVGHMATYGSDFGGKFGKAAVAFFDWHLKGNQASGKQFLDPTTSPLTKDGWDVVSKGYGVK